MNIKGLRVFVNIIDLGTLAKASEKLNLSTPAASRLLGLLEADLGGQLFLRKSSRLVPTQEAEIFYGEALRILAAIDGGPAAYREIARGSERRLRVACGPRLNTSLVLPALSRLVNVRPAVSVHLETSTRGNLTSLVANNLVDVGVGPLPATSDPVLTEYICHSSLLAILPPGHEFAGRTSLRMEDLTDMNYIGLRQTSFIRNIFDSTSGVAHHEPRHIVSTIAAACHLVHDGIGFTIADSLALSELHADKLETVPLQPVRTLEFGLYVNRDSERHDAVDDLLTSLRQVAAESPLITTDQLLLRR